MNIYYVSYKPTVSGFHYLVVIYVSLFFILQIGNIYLSIYYSTFFNIIFYLQYKYATFTNHATHATYLSGSTADNAKREAQRRKAQLKHHVSSHASLPRKPTHVRGESRTTSHDTDNTALYRATHIYYYYFSLFIFQQYINF